MEKLACTNLPGFSVSSSPKVPYKAPLIPMVGVKPRNLRGPCARCGVSALIMDDPYSLTARPICPDHFFEHLKQAKEYLAQQVAIPVNCLKFSDLLLPSARTLLMADPNKPVSR